MEFMKFFLLVSLFLLLLPSCNKTLDNHAPLKKKYVRGDHSPFMNKSLSK